MPTGRRDGQRDTVGHAVGHADELDRERPNRHALSRLDDLEPVSGIDAVLLELGLDERQRHRRAVDRAVEQLDDVRNRADVILVPVREDQRLDLVAAAPPRRSCPGMIRSTPSWSGSGNMTPASMRMVVSSHDSAIMFMPNSPRPPRGDDLERRWRHDWNSGLIHSEPSVESLIVPTTRPALAGRHRGVRRSFATRRVIRPLGAPDPFSRSA